LSATVAAKNPIGPPGSLIARTVLPGSSGTEV
jgi:hypothetical protein